MRRVPQVRVRPLDANLGLFQCGGGESLIGHVADGQFGRQADWVDAFTVPVLATWYSRPPSPLSDWPISPRYFGHLFDMTLITA